ncbi:hypothetical protein BDF19DRAFT_436983 [Syncephalis fuscata]|nr:hypothetical protein BDF19DRAFT_436983 [Syncephalis fuscata]
MSHSSFFIITCFNILWMEKTVCFSYLADSSSLACNCSYSLFIAPSNCAPLLIAKTFTLIVLLTSKASV